MIQLWLEEEERALAEGYNGLRIAGTTSFVIPGDWSSFMEYERAVSNHFNGRRIVALCSYAPAQYNISRPAKSCTHTIAHWMSGCLRAGGGGSPSS